jgi:hypothetical protein
MLGNALKDYAPVVTVPAVRPRTGVASDTVSAEVALPDLLIADWRSGYAAGAIQLRIATGTSYEAEGPANRAYG